MTDHPDNDAPQPGLYLVATPIGNLGDISLRALDVLRSVQLVLAEDTRRTRKLLSHFDIHVPLKSMHEHNEAAQAEGLVERMAGGESMALVSDAGTPLVSDPGHELVREALAAGVGVVPIPGASAVIAALSASGLPLDSFTFGGFAPRKRNARVRFFEKFVDRPETLVFLESPRRAAAAIADAGNVFGDRQAVVARELTKVHEEFIRGTLPEIAARLAAREVRGEVTLCIAGCSEPRRAEATLESQSRQDLDRQFAELLADGTPRNEALKTLAHRYGVPRREVYQALLVEEEENL